MSGVCQCCGGTGIEVDDGIEAEVEALRRVCHANGIAILPGDRGCMKAAAFLLGVTYGTIRNKRMRGEIASGRSTYSLAEIAMLRERDDNE